MDTILHAYGVEKFLPHMRICDVTAFLINSFVYLSHTTHRIPTKEKNLLGIFATT